MSTSKASFSTRWAIVGILAVVTAASVLTPVAPAASNPYKALNQWVNGYLFTDSFLNWADAVAGEYAAHYLVMYVRDLVAGSIVYYVTAGIWHYCLYVRWMEDFFPEGKGMPTSETIRDQMQLAQCSMFLYAGLPVLSEWFIEEGFTKVYYSVDDIGGWPYYALYMLNYFAVVEVGIYWVHRTLHTNKFLYKYVHALHHKYNKPETLGPWASVAFNPLDGIAQCSPYVLSLFFIPCHYLSHVAMVFLTAIWATYIHDAMSFNSEPIMGSKYHTVHHTHFMYNFGQVFTTCDWLFGTLRDPVKDVAQKKMAKASL